MADRRQILDFCDELLSVAEFEDYGPNGLQVPGSERVSRIATGVTANRELLERAVDSGAQLVLAHHGLLWGDEVSPLSVPMASRLRALLCADVSLAAYHLPLDAHPEIGNNALLRERLGLERGEGEFGLAKGRAIGVIGRAREPLEIGELSRRLTEATGHWRAERAGDGRGSRVRRPLPRRRPLRDRDLRHPAPGRAGGGAFRGRARVHRRAQPNLRLRRKVRLFC
jgi:putative NIF3 family GTP cyclohydrolase 1 type 2